MADGETLLPHRASVMSSTRRTDTPGKVHLNKSFFHAALTASILLNNSSLKRNAFEFKVTFPEVVVRLRL